MGDRPHVFDTQSAAVLQELDLVAQPCSVAAGDLLFVQGDPADGAWLIDEGTVQLEMDIPGRAPTIIATVRPGDLLGEPALMRTANRSLSARATHDVVAQFIDRRDFQALLYGLRPASFRLLKRVAQSTAAYLADALAMTTDAQGRPPDCPPTEAGPRGPCDFDPRPFLGVLPFFADLGPRDADALLGEGTLCSAHRGETLVSAGCKTRSVWVVLRGAVEVMPPGASQRSSLLGPGHAVGVHPLLLDQPAPSHVRIRESAALVEYTGDALHRLLAGETRASFKFMDALTRDLLRSLDRANRGLARATLSRSLAADAE
ncbi:MAG: cyclic nucleotide-binding domain-containing protein [Deltaproteobacteria bacterium]|nr:cyclic nucleotide-binding domain-containing protein [Deltaproteobacteria bacterium]